MRNFAYGSITGAAAINLVYIAVNKYGITAACSTLALAAVLTIIVDSVKEKGDE